MKLNPFASSAALVFSLLACGAWAAEPETVYLSSLDLSPIVQGWGQPQADKAVTGKPMSIGGKTFERGLGTHTDSLVRLQLKGGSERFMAFVGVDDAAGSDHATISFRVMGDGKVLFRTTGMKRGKAARKVEVDVKGVKMLLLDCRFARRHFLRPRRLGGRPLPGLGRAAGDCGRAARRRGYPHSQAPPHAAHQRGPHLRRAPGASVPVHDSGDGRPADDVRRGPSAQGPDG